MLLEFSVTNHRSIRQRMTLSLAPTADRMFEEALLSPDGKRKILPVLALYGPNAAGKSNALHALSLMKSMVAGKDAKPLQDAELPQEPFAFTEEVLPTTFEVIYYYDGIKYAYGFSFTKRKIVEEYLYHWRKGREGLIFSRKNGKYEFRENISEQTVLAGRTPENRLYFVTSNEWNNKSTHDPYLWFTRQLISLSTGEGEYTQTIAALGKRKSRIITEMMVADLGIVDISVTDNDIVTTHRRVEEDGKERLYNLRITQESHGTQKFFSRIGPWLQTLESGGTLIVDEIESSMHPLLTRHLVETVQRQGNQAQLIFTTHDCTLLDQKLLRRDQIWFAEKNEKTAETDLYALTEFSPRKDENVQKGYLQGRYGAIPFINGGEIQWAE